MKILKISLLSLSTALLMTACSSGKVKNDLVNALPENIQFVFGVDYSGGDRDKFRKLKEKLPEVDLFQKLLENAELTKDEKKLAEDLKKLASGEWEAVGGFSAIEDKAENYIVARFKDSGKFEKLFTDLMAKEGIEIETSSEGNKKYFVNEEEDLFLVRFKDVFIFSNAKENLDMAVDRLAEGEGFQKTDFIEDRLVYAYVGKDFNADLMRNFYSEEGADEFQSAYTDIFGSMEDGYMAIDVESNGFSSESFTKISDRDQYEKLAGDLDYKVKLVESVNGDGVIFYSEMPSFAALAEPFMYGFLNSINQADSSLVPASWSEDFIASWADSVGIGKEEFEAVLQSPYAFVISDVGQLYPAFSMIVDLEDGEVENAKKITLAVDGWVNQVIAMFDQFMAPQGFGVGALKKDVKVIGGGGLHKLYVDLSVIPEEMLAAAAFVPGLDVNNIKVEFYYGITADNKWVMALQPDFASTYGKNVLAKDADFKDAVDKIGGTEGFSMTYGNTGNLLSLVERWVGLAVGAGALTAEDKATFELYGKDLVGSFRSMVSRSWLEGDVVWSKGFVSVE